MVLLFLLARRRKWQAGRPRYHPISDSRFQISDLKMSRERDRPGCIQPASRRVMVLLFLLARRRKWQARRPRYHPISDFETTPEFFRQHIAERHVTLPLALVRNAVFFTQSFYGYNCVAHGYKIRNWESRKFSVRGDYSNCSRIPSCLSYWRQSWPRSLLSTAAVPRQWRPSAGRR